MQLPFFPLFVTSMAHLYCGDGIDMAKYYLLVDVTLNVVWMHSVPSLMRPRISAMHVIIRDLNVLLTNVEIYPVHGSIIPFFSNCPYCSISLAGVVSFIISPVSVSGGFTAPLPDPCMWQCPCCLHQVQPVSIMTKRTSSGVAIDWNHRIKWVVRGVVGGVVDGVRGGVGGGSLISTTLCYLKYTIT